MAFSFKNIINKIKEVFKPPTYFNVDTGEIVKKRIYKQLDEQEKSSYTPTVKFDELHKSPKIPTNEIKQERKRNAIDNKVNKKKTYQGVKPKEPPKKIKEHTQPKSEELIPTISSIDELKKRLKEIERKVHPIIDLTSSREFFLSIVENNESYYEEENSNPYIDYLLNNTEQISEAIYSVEYLGSAQEDVQGYISSLAYLLNMGALTPIQAEELSDLTQSGWNDINYE